MILSKPPASMEKIDTMVCPELSSESCMPLEVYSRGGSVTNVDDNPIGRNYFDEGLRLMFSFFFEEAFQHFVACTRHAPHCALAHAMAAHCHGTSYSFTGEAYYINAHYVNDDDSDSNARQNCMRNFDTNDYMALDNKLDNEQGACCSFPCQCSADHHSAVAMEKVQELEKIHNNQRNGKKMKCLKLEDNTKQLDEDIGTQVEQQPDMITSIEAQLIMAIRKRACKPGIEPSLAEQSVGRPYAYAMREVYAHYPSDPEVAYLYADSLMVLNAWNLYDYPLGQELSDDVPEIRKVLEESLKIHPHHAGLCHLYVHLCEMSPTPEKALPACETLRTRNQDAGHLLHMPTHIDALLGDYEACVKYNDAGILAHAKMMEMFPKTTSVSSFYFKVIMHNYDMLVYAAILGAMERKGMECALKLNDYLTEDQFLKNPHLTSYLEAHASLDVHVLVRFGRWHDILLLALPVNPNIMLYRSASIRYARALAYANLGDNKSAKGEAKIFEQIRDQPDTVNRYLDNNSIADILNVESLMVKGEIQYFDGRHEEGFHLLRKAVYQQDNLHYDEPWGVMQPIRHALGGLLLKQGFFEEAEDTFRLDLVRHPNNPWALVGLTACLKQKLKTLKQEQERRSIEQEYENIQLAFQEQRKSEWADYNVTHSCMCANKKCCSKDTGAIQQEIKQIQ